MEAYLETAFVVTSYASLSLTVLASIPTALSIARRLTGQTSPVLRDDLRSVLKPLYVDEDGEATHESLEASSGRWQRIGVLLPTVAGLGASLADAVVSGNEDFLIPFLLQSGVWVLLSVQAATLSLERLPTQRFALSQYASWTSTLAMVTPCLGTALAWYKSPPSLIDLSSGLSVTQLAAAILRAGFCNWIPRRPDVFFNGRLVDRQYTVSLFSRLTFGWANDLIRSVTKDTILSIDDLPELPFAARSEPLLQHLEATRGKHKLWRALFSTHLRPLVRQLLLGVVSCLLSFGPQVALYGILKSLEERQVEPWGPTGSWYWVVVLGIVMLLSSIVESRLSWVIYAEISIPIYQELTAMIFTKSMRLKKTGAGKPLEGEPTNDAQRNITNLATVDVQQIADFASALYLIPSYILKLVIACGLIVELIGWKSLLPGLLMAALALPLNALLSKRIDRSRGGLTRATDSRVAVLLECLRGIHLVKICALERQWHARIAEKRGVELECLWTTMLYRVGLISIRIFVPMILSTVSLATYALANGRLTASVAFTTISIFSGPEIALANLPGLLAKGVEAFASTRRIDAFITSAEKESGTPTANIISLRHATLSWPVPEQQQEHRECFRLHDLDLTFPFKGLSLITGRTGSGKSLLLASILRDCDIVAGSVDVPLAPLAEDRFDRLATPADWIIDSALACVSQIPWIENATVRDNILFGLPYDESRYRKVLFSSTLDKDLEALPSGDHTEIGENGEDLSERQTWIISFARALYSRAGILVIDGIFGALDAQTSHHIYEHGLTGAVAQGRTRIIATPNVDQCLPGSDYCVVLDGGSVQHAGTADELRKVNTLAHLFVSQEAEQPVGDGKEVPATTMPRLNSRSRIDVDTWTPRKFVRDARYFVSGKGVPVWAISLLLFVVYIGLFLGRSWWLSVWMSPTGAQSPPGLLALVASNLNFHIPSMNVMGQTAFSQEDNRLSLFTWVYVGISIGACVFGAFGMIVLLSATIKLSKNLHNDMLLATLRAPMWRLNNCFQGHVLSRFVTDMSLLDSRLGYDLGLFFGRSLEIAGIAVIGALACYPITAGVTLLFAASVRLSLTYLSGVRELKRLEKVTKIPISDQFSSCIKGLTTIRAFGRAEAYIRIMHTKINKHARASWNLWLLNSWLSFRLSLLVAVFSAFTAAVVVYLETIPASVAGLILSLILRYSYLILTTVQLFTNVEIDMSAAKRVMEYTKLETEDQGGKDVPAAWPAEGRLEVHGLVASYAPESPPSLNGLTFTIEPNQRVGIVGRQGSGKSSVALALFRFLDIRHGQVYIDGIDVSKIKLHNLRSRMAMIPQDPALFSGTVRSNMDPFDQYSDAELCQALKEVNFLDREEANGNSFLSLSSSVLMGGVNLSQGQRQLLCLARAVVSRSKILVMDEATSGVDTETDALIQLSLRSVFGRNAITTLIVVAHRLSTVAEFDHILVIEAGKLVEFGSPRDLIGLEGGVFRDLAEKSGEEALLRQIMLGEDAGAPA